jgi:NAD(P)-dependent dehydrogenase (short-subunit alcohol dehydrogenase family)
LSRRILITGAASGIGAAAARAFAAAGEDVIGLDLQGGADGQTYVIDVSDAAALDAFLAGLEPIDVLVNAAGVPGTHAPERIIAVNVLAPRRLTEALLPRLKAGGSVVHVSSGAGWRCWRPPQRARRTARRRMNCPRRC